MEKTETIDTKEELDEALNEVIDSLVDCAECGYEGHFEEFSVMGQPVKCPMCGCGEIVLDV